MNNQHITVVYKWTANPGKLDELAGSSDKVKAKLYELRDQAYSQWIKSETAKLSQLDLINLSDSEIERVSNGDQKLMRFLTSKRETAVNEHFYEEFEKLSLEDKITLAVESRKIPTPDEQKVSFTAPEWIEGRGPHSTEIFRHLDILKV